MPFLYIIAIIIALVIDWVIAQKFAAIAEMKGHAGTEYFWITFFFGIVGMLMVIALPDLVLRIKPAATTPQEKPKNIFKSVHTTSSGTTHSWRCDNCGKMTTQSPCEHCGK